MVTDIKTDYNNSKIDYKNFQKEVFLLLKELQKKNKGNIDIVSIVQRPSSNIKGIKSIINKMKRYEKYPGIHGNIKDISGVRVTCHCEDDRENFSLIIEGELKKRYFNIDRKAIGEDNTGHPYSAIHLRFSKSVKILLKIENIYCEVQIRTVMANAWAVQDHKYIYKSNNEGDPRDLTIAISQIMNGCEKLWSLAKKKYLKIDSLNIDKISKLHKETSKIIQIQKGNISINIIDYNKWLNENKKKSFSAFNKLGINTFLEINIYMPNYKINIPKKDIRDSAYKSQIKTFGWPIGVFLDREEYKPIIDKYGIYTEFIEKKKIGINDNNRYDYWAINCNGAFYSLKSLFENEREPEKIFFNTRIVRITEILMYIRNLYIHFGIDENEEIKITIKHGGIMGKILGSSNYNRALFREYKSSVDLVSTSITTTMKEIDLNIVDIVEGFTKELFEYFDFFELEKKVLSDIVNNFVNGKVT